MSPLRHWLLQYPMDHGAASYNREGAKLFRQHASPKLESQQHNRILLRAGPQSNTLTPLLQHSVLSPAQGTADQSCYLTHVRCATVVLCGSNVPEIAQAVEKGEVILWASYLDAALHPPGPPAAQPALQGSLWRSPVSFSLQRTSKNNSNCGHLKVFTKGRKATLKQVAEKEVTAMKKMQRKCQKADAVILSPNTQLHGTSCTEDELQGSHFTPKPFGWNICGVILCWVIVSL